MFGGKISFIEILVMLALCGIFFVMTRIRWWLTSGGAPFDWKNYFLGVAAIAAVLAIIALFRC